MPASVRTDRSGDSVSLLTHCFLSSHSHSPSLSPILFLSTTSVISILSEGIGATQPGGIAYSAALRITLALAIIVARSSCTTPTRNNMQLGQTRDSEFCQHLLCLAERLEITRERPLTRRNPFNTYNVDEYRTSVMERVLLAVKHGKQDSFICKCLYLSSYRYLQLKVKPQTLLSIYCIFVRFLLSFVRMEICISYLFF